MGKYSYHNYAQVGNYPKQCGYTYVYQAWDASKKLTIAYYCIHACFRNILLCYILLHTKLKEHLADYDDDIEIPVLATPTN